LTEFSASLPTEYGPLVRELQLRSASRRQPIGGVFELTERCNLACCMCYIRQSPDNAVRQAKELSAAAWVDLARQAVDNGTVFLLLTGGEVFLRPDFFKIYAPLTRLGLVITLFTNGTLLSETEAARLAQAPPSRTEITVYGATADTYESVTGVSGSYARCCAGIEALLKHSVPLSLKSTITRQNMNELDAMRRMAQNWGLPFSAASLLHKRSDGGFSDIAGCRLSAAECVALEADDRVFTEKMKAVLLDADLRRARNFSCDAGTTSFLVNSQGEMKTCFNLPVPAPRPLETGFRTAWKDLQAWVDSAPPLAPVCLACDAGAYCPRCPAWSASETGTLSEPVPYLCEIAHALKGRYERTT
jgi:MoaA/NifB/PqqE/SkfB family radical SAM enzyme